MDNKPKAIIFMLICAFAFSGVGAMVKLAGDVPVFEKVFFRNLVSLFVAIYMIRSNKASYWGKPENRKVLFARASLGLIGVILYFYAISNLFLADSNMLNKLSPFFVTIFAALFLKEKLSPVQIPALLIVFVGAMMIIKPEFDLSVLPALAGFGSAITAGAAYTIVRYLKDREEPATIVFLFSFVSVLGTIPLVMMEFVLPTGTQLVFLIGTGVFAAIGQFALTYAYKLAPAAEISIYNYFSILFSAMLGFVLWGEMPDAWSMLGGVLVVLAALATFWYSNKQEQAKVGVSM